MRWTPSPILGVNVPESQCHWSVEQAGASAIQITTVNLDLAKNVCLIGMEACGGGAL
jgi:hypothetical protein